MDHEHETLTFVAGLGHAISCGSTVGHRPRPLRYVWHHILPQVCGGRTQADNLVSLCDNCHYAVHVLLWKLAQGRLISSRTNAYQAKLARQGYELAVRAGTVGKIPQESSAASVGPLAVEQAEQVDGDRVDD